MPKQVKLLRVVVASPSDVQPERDILPDIVDELNRGVAAMRDVWLELCRWETDAYPSFHPEGPQGLVDSVLQIKDCDILIGIFWKRFGTPTSYGTTGTEHEIESAYQSWKVNLRPEIMVYFSQNAFRPESPEEIEQWSRVLDFKRNFSPGGLWWDYKGPHEFANLVRRHLTRMIRERTENDGATRTSVTMSIGTMNPRSLNTIVNDAFTRLTYTTTRSDNRIVIEPSLPYLDAVRAGQRVRGLHFWRCPFHWSFPELDIRLVNNTKETVFFDRATIRVRESSLDESTVLVARLGTSGEVAFRNEGWGDVRNPLLEFDRSPFATFPSGTNEKLPYTAPIESFDEDAAVDITDIARRQLPGNDVVGVVGNLRFDKLRNEVYTGNGLFQFQTTVRLEPAGMGVLAPPSWQYEMYLELAERSAR